MAHFGLIRLQGDDGRGFVDLTHPHLATVPQRAALDRDFANGRLRVVVASAPVGAATVQGATSWLLPVGTAYSTSLDVWGEPLRDACFAELRTRGNLHRQLAVRAFLQDCVANRSELRQWATMRSASFLQPYWHVDNVEHGRRLLRQALGRTGFEVDARRRPHKATKQQNYLRRLDDPRDRKCYACDGAAVETTEHVLLRCPHRVLAQLRQEARTWLRALAREPEAVAVARSAGAQPPDFGNDTDLWVVLQACGSLGPAPVLQPAAVPAAGGGEFVADPARARDAAAWLSALVQPWTSAIRDARRTRTPQAFVGGRLLAGVAAHSLRVREARKKLLRSVPAFRNRDLDPAFGPVVDPGGPAGAGSQAAPS